MIVSLESYNLCVWSKYYLRSFFNSANQVSRHLVGQTSRSDEHVYPLCILSKEYGCLTGRISSTNDNHLFTFTQLRFHGSRSVINTCAFKVRQFFALWLPIGRTGCNHNSTCRNSNAVLDFDNVRFMVTQEPQALGDENLCAELLCLKICPTCKILT